MSRILTILLLAVAARSTAAAQAVPFGEGCPGGRISFVFIDSNSIFDTSDPELDDRFRWAYDAANALHVRTREWVIRRELLFQPGDCYDPFVLAETERVLRGYRFLAQVDIYGVEQTDGSWHVIVDTHDDWSTRLDLRVRLDNGLHFDGVKLNEVNFLGMGQTVGAFWHERDVTRDYGLTYWAPQVGRSRWDLGAGIGRTRAGTMFREEVGYPFVGELGHWAGRESWIRDEQFFDYILFDEPDASSPHILVPVRDERFEASLLRRFGDRGRAMLAGLGLSSRRLTYPGPVEIAPVEDFDQRVPADSITASEVGVQGAEREALRVHMLLGARDVHWIKRRGLDGMQSDEDVRLGIEMGVDVGRSLPAWGDDDISITGLLYGGLEAGSSVFVLRGRADGLRSFGGRPHAVSPWEDVSAGVDLLAYLRTGRTAPGTLLLRASAAGAWHTRTPFQLTLGGERGIRGYDIERFPGGRRLVLTAEHRQFLGWPWPGLFDTGVTAFVDAGRIWRGDVPYGIDSGWQASVGTGLRLAFPAGSRTTYRVDIAWPLEHGSRLSDFRIRFSIGDLIGMSGIDNDLQFLRSRPDGVAGDLFRFNIGPGS